MSDVRLAKPSAVTHPRRPRGRLSGASWVRRRPGNDERPSRHSNVINNLRLLLEQRGELGEAETCIDERSPAVDAALSVLITGWFLAGNADIAGFLGLEAQDRTLGSASSLNASHDDQGMTRMIAITYGLAAELPLVIRRLPAPQLPPMAGPAGLMVQAAVLALRAWSMRTLGASYSRTLRVGTSSMLSIPAPTGWCAIRGIPAPC
jgi:hypothetical protein